MSGIRSSKYITDGGLAVYRASLGAAYDNASEEIRQNLDECQGVLFSSGFEFPGRYTRWDIGFIHPPLKIVSRKRTMEFVALNERGELLLRVIGKTLANCEAISKIQSANHRIALMLHPPREVVFEEERSRQLTVFSVLREIIQLFSSNADPFLGLYGAFGYELAFQFEAVEEKLPRDEESRDLVLYLPDDILVVDHQKEIAHKHTYDFETGGQTTRHLPRVGPRHAFRPVAKSESRLSGDHAPGEYAATVRKALEYFARGDLFETVPSQMFREPVTDSPAAVFKRLCESNPAPYGALLNLGGEEYLVAASPEMFVRVERGDSGLHVETCPISGTITRGENAIEDARQIRTLLNSAKDEAELSMCTDVDRNDKSRICIPGTVKVIGRRQTELYSRLIHTVDHVEGVLRPEFDALDAFLSHAWAVTVTGAPKKAAIQFIEDHEKSPRRWYGGAMGFLRFNGEINTGLTLRTIRIDRGIAEVRVGATLLADSDPEAEEAETRLKASALMASIRNEQAPVQDVLSAGAGADGQGMTVLMVDHQDSFVHTLSACFQETGAVVKTVRPENVEQVLAGCMPDLVVLSPGPGRPADFNLAGTITLCLSRRIPLFGVCLGLQGIVEYFGGKLSTLDIPMHGKSSVLKEVSGFLFQDVAQSVSVGRYHSLVATDMPQSLVVTATTDDGVVMAVEHKSLPVSAVQFHPESILSLNAETGAKIISNVVRQVTMTGEA